MNNNQTFRDFVGYDGSNEKAPYKVKSNTDDFKEISNWRFETEEVTLLAISLYLATPQGEFNVNEFRYTFKMVLRMIKNTDSEWSK